MSANDLNGGREPLFLETIPGQASQLTRADGTRLGSPVTATSTSDGGMGIVGPDGKKLAAINSDPRPQGKTIWSARSLTGMVFSTGARAPQSTSYGPDGVRVVCPINTDDSTNNYTIINLPDVRGGPTMPRTVAIRMYSPDWSKVARFVYYVGTTGYAKFFTRELNAGSTNTKFAPGLAGAGWRTFWINADDYVPSGAATMADTAVVQKIHLYSKLGTAADVTFARDDTVVFNGTDTPTISIVSDDGYKTWFDNSLPILNARNLRAGIAVIADRVGYSATFMTWDEMRVWVAAGHYCHTHGCRDGLDNLGLYGSVAEAVADAVWNRAQIRAQGCAVDGAENVYIFPQGVYYMLNDVYRRDLTDALLAEGFICGRSGRTPQTFHTQHFRDTASRMILPIMGYAWSSTDESNNVSAVRARIASTGTYGYSGSIMFHKLVTTPTTGIECAITQFTQFMDDIETQVITNGVRVVGMHKQVDDLVYA